MSADFFDDQSPEAYEARAAKKTAWQLEQAKIKAQVLDLRLAGKSYEYISKKFGKKTRSWSNGIVKKTLRCIWIEKAEALFRIEMLRLDKMSAGLWKKAVKGDVDAVKAVLAIMDRRKAWEEMMYGRKKKEPARIDLSPEKKAFLEDALRRANIEYENQNAGIQSLAGSLALSPAELVDRELGGRSGEVEMV